MLKYKDSNHSAVLVFHSATSTYGLNKISIAYTSSATLKNRHRTATEGGTSGTHGLVGLGKEKASGKSRWAEIRMWKSPDDRSSQTPEGSRFTQNDAKKFEVFLDTPRALSALKQGRIHWK